MMDHAPGFAAADDGGTFDPRQAAALLDQSAAQARRAFTPGTPALFAFRAVLVLVVGLVGAVTASFARDRSAAGAFLLIVVVAAGFAGPAGAWLVMGIGLCAVCLVVAADAAGRRHRGVVGS